MPSQEVLRGIVQLGKSYLHQKDHQKGGVQNTVMIIDQVTKKVLLDLVQTTEAEDIAQVLRQEDHLYLREEAQVFTALFRKD